MSSWGGQTDKWDVVGGSQILSTRDGGRTWSVRHAGHGYLRSLVFVDRQHGWAVGDAVLMTVDGGSTWTSHGPRGTDVDFVDVSTGWVVAGDFLGRGEYVYHTTDGGETWTLQWHVHGYDERHGLEAVDFIDARQGWAVGLEGRVLHSDDGGATWTVQDSGTWVDLHDVGFLDAAHGCVVGDGGTLLVTSDGGATWTLKRGLTPVALTRIAVVRPSRLVACGPYGTMLVSDDRGETWSVMDPGADAAVVALDFVDARHGWLATGSSREVEGWRTSPSDLLATDDGGATWACLSRRDVPADLEAVDFVSPQTGWVAGAGCLMRTDDGGLSWRTQSAADAGVADVDFADAETGLMVDATGAVLRSVDGGDTWSEVLPGPTGAREIGFPARSSAWAAGGDDIWFTQDAGDTWEHAALRPPTLAEEQRVLAFHIASEREWRVLVSDTGGWSADALFHTVDGGRTWTAARVPHPAAGLPILAYDLAFGTDGLGYVVGSMGGETSDRAWQIYRTTDDGRSWTYTWGGTFWSSTLRTVTIVDEDSAWAVGDRGSLTRTDDGGLTWAPQADGGLTADLRDVCFVDADHGWIVGADGSVLHTVTGGEPDTTAPVTTQTGADAAWHRHAVEVRLAARDPNEPYALGVAATEWRLDAGPWTEGEVVTVTAPPDHSNDGVHTLAYRSRDNGGNVEEARHCVVAIDTAPPAVSLPRLQDAGASFTVTVDDRLSPTCRLEVQVFRGAGHAAVGQGASGARARRLAAYEVEVASDTGPQKVALPPGLRARLCLLVVRASDRAGNRTAPVAGLLRLR